MAPTAYAKRCKADLKDDVHLMILEYLVYSTTTTLLEQYEPQKDYHYDQVLKLEPPANVVDQLHMVDAFLVLFQQANPPHTTPPALAFWLQLLRFTTLYTLRSSVNLTTPSLEALAALQQDNEERAKRWRTGLAAAAFDLDTPLNECDLRNDQTIADNVSPLLTLLDLIPSFIQLTAARADLAASTVRANPGDDSASVEENWSTSRQWLELAAELMLHACLEKLLVHGGHPAKVVHGAFAWGSDGATTNPVSAVDDHAADVASQRLNAMFDLPKDSSVHKRTSDPLDIYSGYSSANNWQAMRKAYINELTVPQHPTARIVRAGADNGPETHHFRSLSSKHPLASFEARLCVFLAALLDSIPPPLLVQLERGTHVEVDGMVLDGDDVERIRSFLLDG